jgi:D-alanyl-D-alanine dipeptidase
MASSPHGRRSDVGYIERNPMKNTAWRRLTRALTASFMFLACAIVIRPANAQGPELQQRVAEIKEATAQNKQALMSYSWNELVTISLKGEQKKQEHFQVRLGPDGKPVKTSLDPPAEAAPSGGRLKQRVVANKTEEYTDYANAMKALAQQYVPPSGDLLQQAYAQGNVTLGPASGSPNEVQLVIHNYLKPQDSMTLVFDKQQKALLSVQIASYMSDPKDAMTLQVTFSRLPNGPNHVATVVMDGVSKQLNIATQNSNYQHV